MSTFLFVVFSGSLLALMVWLRWAGPTHPNVDLLLETMRDHLVDDSHSEGRCP